MVNLMIDGKPVSVEEGTTILDAARLVGIEIPTLCYIKEINQVGACRICVIEIEGADRLYAACNTFAEEGMKVLTNSPRVLKARRTNLQLILSQHLCECPTCIRNGTCTLQQLSRDLNIVDIPYKKDYAPNEWNRTAPIIRDGIKCIKCARCVNFCEKVQSLGVWEVNGTGARTRISLKGGTDIAEVDCAYCGQCVTHCPVGALHERDDSDRVFEAIADKEMITICQIAPAVRSCWGEGLGLTRKEASVGRMVAAFRRLGIDYIFDTDFAADLTIMEEGSELLEHLKERKVEEGMEERPTDQFPLFTSCCPGWVRFLKLRHPELTGCLSSAKSPQQMFGAVAKTYFAEKLGVDPKKIFCISVMPCTAKKYECDVPQINGAKAGKDVDVVITTREIGRLLKTLHINVRELAEEEFDVPLGMGTGAGIIFGTTGGVMEAALRSAFYLATGKNAGADDFCVARGMDGIKDFVIHLPGMPVRAAVVSGLGNAEQLLEDILAGKKQYDFVEVMACPGGCAGGGGQHIFDGKELAGERSETLYQLDREAEIRFSHENPYVNRLYEEYLERPLSEKAHKLLHTNQEGWTL